MAGYYGYKDVPGKNMIGPVVYDEEVFATSEVTCVGAVRGVGGWREGSLCLTLW